MPHPTECPNCGQINAAENKTCVICGSPLDKPPAQDGTPRRQPYQQPTAASRRAYRTLIHRYMRIFGILKWLGWLPLWNGFILFCAASSPFNAPLFALAVALLLTGAALIWWCPKIQQALEVGEQWPLHAINVAHWLVYGVLAISLAGANIALSFDEEATTDIIACCNGYFFLLAAVNWYFHRKYQRAFTTYRATRDFGALTDHSGRPPHPITLLFFAGVLGLALLVTLISGPLPAEGATESGAERGSRILIAVLLLLFIVMGMGIWKRQMWFRLLVMFITFMIAAQLVCFMFAVSSPEGIALLAGIAGINFLIWRWFNNRDDFFKH